MNNIKTQISIPANGIDFLPFCGISAAVTWHGFINKTQHYNGELNDEDVYVQTLIHADQKIEFEAFLDCVISGVKNAAFSMKGIYRAILLDCDLSTDLNLFDQKRFSDLISRKGASIQAGQTVYVRFCSVRIGLIKLRDSDYGKVDFKHLVKFYRKEPSKIDLEFASVLRDADKSNGRIVIRDIGKKAILSGIDEDVLSRGQRFLKKVKLKNVYYFHKEKPVIFNLEET